MSRLFYVEIKRNDDKLSFCIAIIISILIVFVDNTGKFKETNPRCITTPGMFCLKLTVFLIAAFSFLDWILTTILLDLVC